VVFREVLCDGKTILADEQKAVAVFIGLHLVTGADPASFLGFLRLIGIEIARTKGFSELVLMQRQAFDDYLRHLRIRMEGSATLVCKRPYKLPHAIDIGLRGLFLHTILTEH
jgi:hypothetical protein